MKLIKRSTLTIQQNYQMTIEQKYLLTFISGKDLWLMKLITCLLDYRDLTNEQVEIHPSVEEASNGRSRPGGVGGLGWF